MKLNDMPHIIKKQVIQLRLNSRLDAFRIQNRMSEHYRQDILPVIEHLFDEIAAEDEILPIDTLEIDLGVLTEKDLARPKWDDEILALITRQLRSTLDKLSAGRTKSAGRQPASMGIFGQWLFYMQNGYLPWNTMQTNARWIWIVLEALSTNRESVRALRNLIRLDENALIRIVEQHPEPLLIKLIEILCALREQYLSGLLDELEILHRTLPDPGRRVPSAPNREIRIKFLRIMLEISAARRATGEETEFARHILERCFGGGIGLQALSKEVTSKLPHLLSTIRLLQEKSPKNGLDLSSEIIEETALQQNGQTEKPAEQAAPEDEGIFVRQAGAVLLHPFLNTFFGRLQLTEGGAFRDLATQQQALYLIHYLCTGAAGAEEHELVIPKVLCGYPLKKTVRKGIRLTKKEKEEADHLLVELIRQWEQLKNTSPAGLREGFLQRAGKLMTKNDLWCIQVEANTIDVLLDHLPWNLSIIKLPWMKDIIRIEWR